MKLTRRQEEFIQNLHELSRDADGPIHYTVLAERLGVSPFTAYDMLCLLEEKGLVISQYQLDSHKSGPGRAERLFYPSAQALLIRQQFLNLVGDEGIEPGSAGKVVLEGMCREHPTNLELAQEMLARIPPDTPPGELRYCFEVLTIIALRFRQVEPAPDLSIRLGSMLRSEEPIRRSNLCMLLGFVFGILSRSWSADPDWIGELQMHISECIEIIMHLNPDGILLLGEYASKLFLTPAFADHVLIVRESVG